jgi:VWFA-related protein
MGVLRRHVVAGAAIVVAAAGAAAIAAQEPQSTFRSEANYVRVDVYASAKGENVTDLRQEDFELLEDGVAQTIDTFELVRVSGTRADPRGREPGDLAESRAMLDNGRSRVFVLFLDTLHVDPASSRTIAPPLIRMLTELFAPDDLVAVMTPRMTPRDVTFGRRTTIVERILREEWWSDQLQPLVDETERTYRACYGMDSFLFTTLTARHREEVTLDALEDLMAFLRDLREERKAIIAVTPGWRLFRPDTKLATMGGEDSPAIPAVVTDPRTGTLTTRDATGDGTRDMLAQCQSDRIRLAGVDHEDRFNELLDHANWANASFYPIDPRGLTTSNSIAQASVLRQLAAQTDGTAIVNTSIISPAISRITADLSSYYLLGYRSSSTKDDGKFRRITVKSRRPGVEIRARRGYLPVRTRDVSRAASSVAAKAATSDPATAAYASAIGALAALGRDLPLKASVAWRRGNTGPADLWITSEVSAGTEWKNGGEIELRVARAGGGDVARSRADIAPGTRSVTTRLSAPSLEPGAYAIHVQGRPAAGGAPVSETVNVTVADAAGAGARLVRRGPATGNREAPTADPRVRRNEQLRVEVPAGGSPASARLLDRTGKPLNVPVTVATRTDADGTVWNTAQLLLAPLSPGEYLVEVTAAPFRSTIVGIRVVP